MGIRNLDFVKELVTAFNVSNYGSKTNTNFVVEGNNIVVKFNCDKGSAKQYLLQMARDLVREYCPNGDAANHIFDLASFPFNSGKGEWKRSGAVTELKVPIDSGVIFNLKMHFAQEFKLDVKGRMIKEIDEKHHLGVRRIEESLNRSIKQAKMDPSSGYIKCLLFGSANVQAHFVTALRAQMNEHGCNYLDFCDIDYEDKKVYFKDVEDIDFIRNVTEVSKKDIGYNFYLQHVDSLKVKANHYKDAIGELVFHLTRIPIYRYYYDKFIDGGRISNGERYAFVPMIKDGSNLRYLDYMDANKINAKFSYDLLTNVRGQTEGAKDEFGEVYAFSDRQIALLIPLIIENSVINKDGQIEINPELFMRAVSRSPSTDMSDAELESPKHNQEKQIGKFPRRASEDGAENRMLCYYRSTTAIHKRCCGRC